MPTDIIQDTPITGNGDGQSETPASPPDTWQLFREAEARRVRERLERQLRSFLRRLVAAETVRIGDSDALTAHHITLRMHPFVAAAVEERQAVERFAQLELEL